MVSRARVVVPWLIGVAMAAPAQAQNLDAGKSPAQIFSDTCNACHRSPRELRQTSPGFLREHYTTSGREAAAMAAYLASIGSDPRAVQQRKPPGLGAGGPAPAATETGPKGAPGADQPKPAVAALKPRRPSDSIEAGRLTEASATDVASAPAAGRPRPLEDFEE
jgi:hypothetical protein